MSPIKATFFKKTGRNIPFKLSLPRDRDLNLCIVFLPKVYPEE